MTLSLPQQQPEITDSDDEESDSNESVTDSDDDTDDSETDDSDDDSDEESDGKLDSDNDDADDDFEWLKDNDNSSIGFVKVETKTSKQFTALNLDQIQQQQNSLILNISQLLNISRSAATALLRHYQWDASSILQDFDSEQSGLLSRFGMSSGETLLHHTSTANSLTCNICYSDLNETWSLPCKHMLCATCWKGYLTHAISNGTECLTMMCPGDPDCKFLVDESFIEKFCDSSSLKKFRVFQTRSFVEDNVNIRWCPAAGCTYAIQADPSIDTAECVCGHIFCFKCSEEDHVPAWCKMYKTWKVKEKDESETANWIAANTKDCPKCNRAIEKNGGCNHMTCKLCSYEFCWICMADWKKHGSSTGGFYKCNVYSGDDDAESKRNAARKLLDRYLHYFHRYQTHKQSKRFEAKFLAKTKQKMRDLQSQSQEYVSTEFLLNAAQQLHECRARLQMTYVYVFFLQPSPHKNIFEFQQNDLERVTEDLAELLEKPVNRISRKAIVNMTANARTRLQNLLDTVSQTPDDELKTSGLSTT